MPFLVWDEAYATGIGSIDRDHRQLFHLIGELGEAVQGLRNEVLIGETVTNLTYYARTHLKYEEGLMTSHNYPNYVSHKAQHEHFLRRGDEFMRAYQENQPFLDVEIVQFLREWLTSHILSTDMQYVSYLQERGVK